MDQQRGKTLVRMISLGKLANSTSIKGPAKTNGDTKTTISMAKATTCMGKEGSIARINTINFQAGETSVTNNSVALSQKNPKSIYPRTTQGNPSFTK
jgi:hypothetical protein